MNRRRLLAGSEISESAAPFRIVSACSASSAIKAFAKKEQKMTDDKLVIAGIEFRSRLWVGTGKYKDFDETRRAIEASGTDVVTVAVRRVNIIDKGKENLLDFIDPKKYKILPNTAGCFSAKDAIRYAMLA